LQAISAAACMKKSGRAAFLAALLSVCLAACRGEVDKGVVYTFNPINVAERFMTFDISYNNHIPTFVLSVPIIEYENTDYVQEIEIEDEEIQLYPQPRRPMVALTFDDGPSEHTIGILDALEEHGGRATFFVLGNRVERNADIIIRASELGSEILGHSWDHTSFTRTNIDNVRSQILDTSEAIEYVLGFPTPPMFRAPYGALNSNVRRLSRELGYSIINWTLDTEDWRHHDVNFIYNRIMNNVIDGTIVLLHDIRPYTEEAAVKAIASLTEQGFELVTAGELIQFFNGDLVPGTEYRGMRPGEAR